MRLMASDQGAQGDPAIEAATLGPRVSPGARCILTSRREPGQCPAYLQHLGQFPGQLLIRSHPRFSRLLTSLDGSHPGGDVPWAKVEQVIGEAVSTAFTAIVYAKLTGPDPL